MGYIQYRYSVQVSLFILHRNGKRNILRICMVLQYNYYDYVTDSRKEQGDFISLITYLYVRRYNYIQSHARRQLQIIAALHTYHSGNMFSAVSKNSIFIYDSCIFTMHVLATVAIAVILMFYQAKAHKTTSKLQIFQLL